MRIIIWLISAAEIQDEIQDAWSGSRAAAPYANPKRKQCCPDSRLLTSAVFFVRQILQFKKTTLKRDRHSVSAIARSKLGKNILDMVLNGVFRNT